MKRKTRKLVTLFFIFFALILTLIVWWGLLIPSSPGSDTKILFIIQKGQGSKQIAQNLKNQDLITSAFFFQAYAFINGDTKKLQAGTYILTPGMSVSRIVKKISTGDALRERLTIIEGWSIQDIAKDLEEKGLFSVDEFTDLLGNLQKIPSKDFSQAYSFLAEKPGSLSYEGYLFPDTYFISMHETLEEIIERIFTNFDKKITLDIRNEIRKQGKTLFEIITLASLLEKEVQSVKDKKLVAGILWKRLEAGMPLQIDATIAYLTGKQTTRISRKETQISSPYNTYQNRGLPIGPIANPGIESIQAALDPTQSPYWFYLSTPQGETIFSKNLDEHNTAKAQYLK